MTRNDSDVIIAKLEGMKELMEEKFMVNDKAHQHLKDALHKKANKWAEHAIKFLMAGTAAWALSQILNLIPRIQTAYQYFLTIT